MQRKQNEGYAEFSKEVNVMECDLFTKDELNACPRAEKNDTKRNEKESNRKSTSRRLIEHMQVVAENFESNCESKKSKIVRFTIDALNNANNFDARNATLERDIAECIA